MKEKLQYKEIDVNGRKMYEQKGAKLMLLTDYGINKVQGAEIAQWNNIDIGFKVDNEKSYVMLSGYLNNKLIPGTDEPAIDSYGDIPVGDSVYDISRLKNNPVALVNHDNSAAGIAGNFIFLEETKQGLKFREILRPLEDIHNPIVKDTVSAWASGFGKAYSIGGVWMYDAEKSDPEQGIWYLVKAETHEASHVALGADKWALSIRPTAEEGKGAKSVTLEAAIREYASGKGDELLGQFYKQKENQDNGQTKKAH